MEPNKLSDQSRAILEAIAKGHTYEQILVQDLAWTYHDIFQAAADAREDSPKGWAGMRAAGARPAARGGACAPRKQKSRR
jgi:hypothetical protein